MDAPTAAESGLSVAIETPYDGLPRWQWVLRGVLRALMARLVGGVPTTPPATVVVKQGSVTYRRYRATDLDAAARLAAQIQQELDSSTADEFRARRRP
jgi:hypothetical protein